MDQNYHKMLIVLRWYWRSLEEKQTSILYLNVNAAQQSSKLINKGNFRKNKTILKILRDFSRKYEG